MFEYKVLTERDTRFSGKFDPEGLERTLNGYGADGWRVVDGFLASNIWKTTKSELLVILERPRVSE